MKDFSDLLFLDSSVVNEWLTKAAFNIITCILVLIFGFWLSKRLAKVVSLFLKKRNLDQGLITFTVSFTSILSRVMVLLLALTQLGVAMTSFVALLGAVGIAFGVAFGGILTNFAGGVLILVIKPFRIRDTINALNVTGEVMEIQMFNTYIRAVDNKVVVLPNGPLINGVITNFTREGRRRVDLIIPFPYQLNALDLISRIKELIAMNPLILKDPAPAFYFTDFEGQSGKLNINCWVVTENYSLVHRELSNAIFPWIEPIPQNS